MPRTEIMTSISEYRHVACGSCLNKLDRVWPRLTHAFDPERHRPLETSASTRDPDIHSLGNADGAAKITIVAKI